MGDFYAAFLILCILAVVLFCIFVIAYLLESFQSSSSLLTVGVPELAMASTKMPVHIIFPHLAKANLKDGIHMTITTEEDLSLLACWGADCVRLTEILNVNPTSLIDFENSQMASICFSVSDYVWVPKSSNESPSRTIELKLTAPTSEEEHDFGRPPRKVYPLVVIVRCDDCSVEEEDPGGSKVIGGVWILHLPDKSYITKAYIISQLIITDHGHVHNLQKMYMATDLDSLSGESTYSESMSDRYTYEQSQETISTDDVPHDCTVCQNGPISQVILPCRHACICERCLHLVSKCPMCRGRISSHFRLRDSSGDLYTQLAQDEVDEHERHILTDTYVERFQNFCERINRALGL